MKEDNKPTHQGACDSGSRSKDDSVMISEDKQTGYAKSGDVAENKKKYRIRPQYILREIAGEYAIIPVDTDSPMENAVMAPNETAVFIWKCFEEPSTLGEVVARGMQEYDVAEEKLRNAVGRFVKESLEYKILEEEE